MHLEIYKEFIRKWDTVEGSLVDCPMLHQKFFFDFLFRLILSFWKSLNDAQMREVKIIAARFYRLKLSKIETHVELIKQTLSEVNLDQSGSFTSVSGDVFTISEVVNLLAETAFNYEESNAYTFDEGISFLPQELSYPPELALQILERVIDSKVI